MGRGGGGATAAEFDGEVEGNERRRRIPVRKNAQDPPPGSAARSMANQSEPLRAFHKAHTACSATTQGFLCFARQHSPVRRGQPIVILNRKETLTHWSVSAGSFDMHVSRKNITQTQFSAAACHSLLPLGTFSVFVQSLSLAESTEMQLTSIAGDL